MMPQVVPRYVQADHILIRHLAHGSQILGSDGLHEQLQVFPVVGQHCTSESRLERGVLGVGLCANGCIKPVDPVVDVQTHNHPIVHPRLEQGLRCCWALCPATPTVHIQDFGDRLIGQPEPVRSSQFYLYTSNPQQKLSHVISFQMKQVKITLFTCP